MSWKNCKIQKETLIFWSGITALIVIGYLAASNVAFLENELSLVKPAYAESDGGGAAGGDGGGAGGGDGGGASAGDGGGVSAGDAGGVSAADAGGVSAADAGEVSAVDAGEVAPPPAPSSEPAPAPAPAPMPEPAPTPAPAPAPASAPAPAPTPTPAPTPAPAPPPEPAPTPAPAPATLASPAPSSFGGGGGGPGPSGVSPSSIITFKQELIPLSFHVSVVSLKQIPYTGIGDNMSAIAFLIGILAASGLASHYLLWIVKRKQRRPGRSWKWNLMVWPEPRLYFPKTRQRRIPKPAIQVFASW